MPSIEETEYTIDDYAEAKSHGAMISDPEYDQLMGEIKICDISLADWCFMMCKTKKLSLPDFSYYFVEYKHTNGFPQHREPIYDKIIHKLIIKQPYIQEEGKKTFYIY